MWETSQKSRRRAQGRRRWRSVTNPAQLVVLTFLAAIAAGTTLLALPIAHSNDNISLLDAFFTATSAVCVTGLATVDTGTDFSGFGQFVILALAQLGGLGVLTFGTILALATGRQIGVGDRMRVQHQLSHTDVGSVLDLVKTITKIVLAAEAVGAIVLYSRMAPEEGIVRGAWFAVFHSVSAFNNAGFSLYSDSLSRYVTDPIVSLTVIALITVGGLGFIVIINLSQHLRPDGPRVRLSLHTKMVVTISAFLVGFGTLVILVFESSNSQTLGALSGPGRLLAALFAAVTPRTAGFNTIDYSQATNATLVFTMLLMFIGGSSGSTAGGVKTTTIFILVASVWSVIRGTGDTLVFDRRIPPATVVRAGAIVFGAAAIGGAGLTLLALLDPDIPLRDLLFESISALGTVGLSTGITGGLAASSKLVVIALMFLGRIGSISFALALVTRHRPSSLRFPAEEVVVG